MSTQTFAGDALDENKFDYFQLALQRAALSPTLVVPQGATSPTVAVQLRCNVATGSDAVAFDNARIVLLSPLQSQTIAFDLHALSPAYGDPPLDLATYGTASSGLPVAFSVDSGSSVCAVNGTRLTLLGVGACNLTARQAGDDAYLAAPPVTQSLVVTKGSTSLSSTNTRGDGVYGKTAILRTMLLDARGRGIAGKRISFTVAGVSVCDGPNQVACPLTADGTLGTRLGEAVVEVQLPQAAVPGSVMPSLVATMSGDAQYADTTLPTIVTVLPADLTIVATPQQMTYGGAPPALSATLMGAAYDDTFASLGGTCTSGTYGTPQTPVGTYIGVIRCTIPATPKYGHIQTELGTLTVVPAPSP